MSEDEMLVAIVEERKAKYGCFSRRIIPVAKIFYSSVENQILDISVFQSASTSVGFLKSF